MAAGLHSSSKIKIDLGYQTRGIWSLSLSSWQVGPLEMSSSTAHLYFKTFTLISCYRPKHAAYVGPIVAKKFNFIYILPSKKWFKSYADEKWCIENGKGQLPTGLPCLVNRPGVAGVVLQTALSLID